LAMFFMRHSNESGNLVSSTKDPRLREDDMVKRYPGIDLMNDICALTEKEDKSVYLLGSGSDEVVKKTKKALLRKFPKLKIVGYNSGPKIKSIKIDDKQLIEVDDVEVIHDIIMTAPDILFVAFGHNKQEKWIYENLSDLPSIKIAMGVGGAFDYISGKVKRAPIILRKIGFEWLYRLIRQPKRIKRIWKATFVFLYYVITKNN